MSQILYWPAKCQVFRERLTVGTAELAHLGITAMETILACPRTHNKSQLVAKGSAHQMWLRSAHRGICIQETSAVRLVFTRVTRGNTEQT